jgi:hypothetical protein
MILVFKVLIILSLLKILNITGKPFLCSGIYALIAFILNLVFSNVLLDSAILASISFVTASIYFWLLNYFQYGWQYWTTLVIGLIIGAV